MIQNKNTNNIYTKLKNIQSSIEQISKDVLNKFQNYKYFTEYQALTFLKPLLNKEGLSLHFEDLAPEETFSGDGINKLMTVKHGSKVIKEGTNWVVQY